MRSRLKTADHNSAILLCFFAAVYRISPAMETAGPFNPGSSSRQAAGLFLSDKLLGRAMNEQPPEYVLAPVLWRRIVAEEIIQ